MLIQKENPDYPLPEASYNFSEINELIQENTLPLLNALDGAMFLMSRDAFENNEVAVKEFTKFFLLKQLRDEITKGIYQVDFS